MTPEQVEMVKNSWKQVSPIAEQAADMFYGKLFELNPAFKALFNNDMKEQGKKLMAMISVAVNSLDKLEAIIEPVKDLGRRHVGYGVKDEDYAIVAQALLWTLEQGLGDAWSEELKAAWTETYTTLAGVMTEAAAEVKAA